MDDVIQDIQPEQVEAVSPEPEQAKDPLVELAQQYGWKPDKGEKGPKEFVEYALQNLEPRGKELKEVKQTLSELKAHMEEQKKAAYLQATKDVEARLAYAVQQGDVESVTKIVEEKQQLNVPKQQANPYDDFDIRHASMINDTSLEAFEIREFVTRRGNDLKNKNLSPDEFTRIVEQDMYKKFPDYFGQTKASGGVEKDTSSHSDLKVNKKFSYSDLSSIQKDVAKYLKEQGISVDTYIEGLVKDGTLK